MEVFESLYNIILMRIGKQTFIFSQTHEDYSLPLQSMEVVCFIIVSKREDLRLLMKIKDLKEGHFLLGFIIGSIGCK